MKPLLQVDDVGFKYGQRGVLESVTFDGAASEFLAIVGGNGAGKSTLLDILSGFRTPLRGTISIAGRDQREWSLNQLARQVSHLPQTVHADLPFTSEQLVGMGRYPHTDRWFESDDDHQRVQAAMERTRSWAFRARTFSSLSGGERQRVLLAACLAQDAALLLLDEPSTFLDIDAQLECFTLLREEARSGKLCIAVTHDLNLALTYCSRLLVLADGHVAKDLDAIRAGEDDSWLPMFSPRLRLGATAEGAPWIWYA